MKQLQKHPRLMKKAAVLLKQLVTTKITNMRRKLLNESDKRLKRKDKNDLELAASYMNFKPKEERFLSVRIFPTDSRTYETLLKHGYNPKLEFRVSTKNKVRELIRAALIKWDRVFIDNNLRLNIQPIKELWGTGKIEEDIELINFDVHDIFTGYGKPNIPILYLTFSIDEKSTNEDLNKSNSSDLFNLILDGADSPVIPHNEERVHNFLLSAESELKPVKDEGRSRKRLEFKPSVIESPLKNGFFGPRQKTNGCEFDTSSHNMGCLVGNEEQSGLFHSRFADNSLFQGINEDSQKIDFKGLYSINDFSNFFNQEKSGGNTPLLRRKREPIGKEETNIFGGQRKTDVFRTAPHSVFK